MNKYIKFLIPIIVLSVNSNANEFKFNNDRGWEVSTSLGIWGISSDGNIVGTINNSFEIIDSFNSNESKGYVSIDVKNPYVLIPNVMFDYNGVETKGESKKTNIFVTIPVQSNLSMSQYEITPYYNLLRYKGFEIDVGATIKFIDTIYSVDDFDFKDETESIVPMAYLRWRFEFEMGLGIERDIKYITDGSSTVYDARAKIDYVFKDLIKDISPGVEIGYRYQHFDINSADNSFISPILNSNTRTKLTFSGVYGGVKIKF